MMRIAWWALIAFAVFYLLTSPAGAAGLITHALDGLRAAASSPSSFVSHL
jgi:hypothetical protein